jgi:trimeric autotransporter adhesin
VRFLCEGGSEGESPPAAATPAAAVAAAEAAAAEVDPQLWRNLPGAALLDLKGFLDAAFAVVLEFFGEVRPYVCGPSVHSYRMAGTVPVAAAEPVQQVSGSALQQLRTLGAACARTLGGWLAEDAGTLRDEFLAALPVILALADSSSSNSNSGATSSSSSASSSSTAAAYSSMATVEELEEVDSDDETAAGATTAWEAQQRAHAAAAPAQSAAQQPAASTDTAGEAQAPGNGDNVLQGLLRDLVALSYEDVALVAMVEEAVPLRTAALLERLAASVPAPPAIYAAPAARTVVSISLAALPPAYRLQPELVQPACWACALLLNTLSRGAHLPASELSAAAAPQYAVGAHPAVTARLLLPLAGLVLAGSAARHSANLAASAAAAAAAAAASSTTAAPASAAAAAAAADALLAEGAQARLLMAYAAGLLLQVARTQGASPGATLDSAAHAPAPAAAAAAGAAVWQQVAAAVAYAVRSLADPCSLNNSQHTGSGELLLGRPRSSSLSSATHEDVSYEEGVMWQWAAESATEIEAACTAEGGSGGNALVRAGVVQPELLACLIQASESGVI